MPTESHSAWSDFPDSPARDPRPGLSEGARGLWRFVPGCLAGGALWAALLWLIERVGR